MTVALHTPVAARPMAPHRPSAQASSLRDRLTGAVITIGAHLVVLAAFLVSVHTVRTERTPTAVMVHIESARKTAEVKLSLPAAPALVRPAAVTAPVPAFSIAAPETAIASSPPKAVALPTTPSAPPALPPSSDAIPTWQGRVLARLESAKRYPSFAQLRREQGVVLLRFTMDRQGRVLSAKIEKSSGYNVLDQETLALIERAQPLPKPPPEVAGTSLELVVPVEFFLKRG